MSNTKINTKVSYNSLSEFVQHNNLEVVATEVINKVFLDKEHPITVDQIYDNTCGEVDCDDTIIEAIVEYLGGDYNVQTVETNNDVAFNIYEKSLADRLHENADNVNQVLKSVLADLEGIMPVFEPSGDRTHSAWKTIDEVKSLLDKINK